jgi:hypothetical protein
VPYDTPPAELRLAVLLLLGLGVVGILLRWGRLQQDRQTSNPWLLACLAGLHGAIYLGLLGVSLTFFDASTRLRDRVLSPLFLVGILVICGVLALSPPALSWRRRIIAAAAFALLVLPYGASAWGRLAVSRQQGLGFVSTAWRSSATVALARELDRNLRLYSNEAFLIYFLTGRATSCPSGTTQ